MANSEPERLSVGRLQWSSMVAVRPKPSATAVDVTKPFMKGCSVQVGWYGYIAPL